MIDIAAPRTSWIVLFALAITSCAEPVRYDLVIRHGTIYDGSGSPGVAGDIAINGDTIAAVGKLSGAGRREIDAKGLVVAPGFIDMHAHIEPLLSLPDAESSVRQGITTALGGPDGSSPWPLAAYLDSVSATGTGINVAYLTGHNTIRREVMGLANRAPTARELEQMRGMVARAMGEGAFGLSTGLRYLPGTFSKTDEVIALSRVAADSGGIYTSHLREEGLGLIEGVAEAIRIGKEAHIPIVLTHHKALGQKMWGKSVATLAMVDSARTAGIDVMMDQYPYTATSTGISVLVPTWALAGGDSAFLRRLENRSLRDSIVRGIVFNLLNDRGGGDLRRVQFARFEKTPALNGKTLYDWAVSREMQPTPENGAELVIEIMRQGGADAIYHVLDEGDVERIMRHPETMIGSDGTLSRPGDGHPHPRAYGTFPRVLGHYARDGHVLSLAEAIHKMTGMPAARLGLKDRGSIAVGGFADLVVFDSATVKDQATFENPHQYPAGVPYVVVNGKVAVDGGKFAGVRAGRVLRRR